MRKGRLLLAGIFGALICAGIARAQATPQDEAAIKQAWEEYVRQTQMHKLDPKAIDAAAKPILADPQKHIQYIIDQIYVPAEDPQNRLGEKELRQAIADLGADSYKKREAATALLIKQGRRVTEALAMYADKKDAEVRSRAELISQTFSPKSTTIARATNECLRRLVPQKELRKAARANILRIRVDFTADSMDIGRTLIAALRVSDDPYDRDLLALTQARRQGTSIEYYMSGSAFDINPKDWDQWPKPPKHDYAGALYRLLDERDANVFLAAMESLKFDEGLTGKLAELEPKLKDKTLLAAVDRAIKEDQTAATERKELLAIVANPNKEAAFADALDKLTSGPNVQRGKTLAKPLGDALAAAPAERKSKLIEALGKFRGNASAPAAANILWPLACDKDAAIAEAARKSIWRLHRDNYGMCNVLNLLGGKVADDSQIDAFRKIIFLGSADLDGMANAADKKLKELARDNTLTAELLTQLQQERSRLETQRKELNLAANDAERKRHERRDEEARKEQERLRLQYEKGHPTPATAGTTTAPEAQGTHAGTITAVNVKDGSASINVGSADGVKKGDVLFIHSGSRFLGRLTIQEVKTNEATGTISDKKGDIAQGDSVTNRLP